MKLRANGVQIDLDEAFGANPEDLSEEELRIRLSNNRLIRRILTATRKQVIADNKTIRGLLK
jgi:hypothetical protein